MVRVPEAQLDRALHAYDLKKTSPPQSQSQAVVCVSTPRMYPRSGYFLVRKKLFLPSQKIYPRVKISSKARKEFFAGENTLPTFQRKKIYVFAVSNYLENHTQKPLNFKYSESRTEEKTCIRFCTLISEIVIVKLKYVQRKK